MLNDRIRERLDGGEVAYGIVNLWPDPDLVELAGACGFDFVFIDAEHGALDIRTCAELVRAATCGGMSSLIRVPYGEMDGVYRYLDLGAHGLIFAHITSAADAQAATVLVGWGLQIAGSAIDTNTWIITIPRTAPRIIVRANIFGIIRLLPREGQPKSITDISLGFARYSSRERLAVGSIVARLDFFT